MSGVKGRSGGRRFGTGPKNKADLRQLHELMDSCVGGADWNSIISALVKKAKNGDVAASRELRAWRFGQIPTALPEDLNEPLPQIRQGSLVAVKLSLRKHVDEEPARSDEMPAYGPALRSEDE